MEGSPPGSVRQTLEAADEAVGQLQRTYFDNNNDDPPSSMSDFRSAASFRSTSISGVEDWCSVTSNNTTLDDWKSIDDDMPEEWIDDDSNEDQKDVTDALLDEFQAEQLRTPALVQEAMKAADDVPKKDEEPTSSSVSASEGASANVPVYQTIPPLKEISQRHVEKIHDIRVEKVDSTSTVKEGPCSPKSSVIFTPQKHTATVSKPVVESEDVLSKLESMKSTYDASSSEPETCKPKESEAKTAGEQEVPGDKTEVPSEKGKTEISRVTYSKATTKTETTTKISYETQTLGYVPGELVKIHTTKTTECKPTRIIPVEIVTETDSTDPLVSIGNRLQESKEWIQLKIQEMHPSMTDIGDNLLDATQLYQQHEKVLERLQTKQSPVEELLRQADELIANQKPRGEVYTAMAENLGLAWKDLNAQLEQRRQILEQAVAFFNQFQNFSDALDRIEFSLSDTYLSDCADECSVMLQRHIEDRKIVLSCSMQMLKEGQHLLELLCEVATHSMGDSRPFHMQPAARQTSTFVERYMESLHDRWRHLESLWTQRKLKLEQSQKRCEFLAELNEVRSWLSIKYAEYTKQRNLGDSLANAEILQHEHSKIENEAKGIQERALKLVKIAEQLAATGNYAGDEVKSMAYELLSDCSELFNVLESRNLLLSISISFFTSAQTALNKLDQIEIQLTTTDASSTPSQQASLNAAIEEISAPAIDEGRTLISKVGNHKPGIQGVTHKVEELESRRKYLTDLCNARQSEYTDRTAAFRNFYNNYNLLISWITSNGLGFLERHNNMGASLPSAKTFVEQHESLQNDLRIKSIEVESLLNTVPQLVCVGGIDAQDALAKSDNLRERWNLLQTVLDKRLRIAQFYLSFHTLVIKVSRELADLEIGVNRICEGSPNIDVKSIEEKLLTLQQGIMQLKNSGRNFLEDSQKVENLFLNMVQPRETVQNILDDLESRKTSLTIQWTNWQNKVSSTKEAMVQWEHLVKDSHRVIKCAHELESKMFPVIPKELQRVDSILPFLENRMIVLLPQIKSVQQEMDKFLKKSDVLCPKDDPHPEGQKVVDELQRMNESFQRKLTDYQILISMVTSYFKNFEELEKMIDMQESQFKMTLLPNDVAKIEALIREHDTCKPTINELLQFTSAEMQQVICKINEAEPPDAALQDRDKIISIYQNRKTKFESNWTEHRGVLDHHLQMCIFNRDMQQINQQIDDLNGQLSSMQQSYRESLPNALATSQAFVQFERTIDILKVRIDHFVSTAERMVQTQKTDTSHISREIQNMKNKFSTFQTQVSNNRRQIDLSIDYHKLVEESEQWFKEGSQILLSVAKRSTQCQTTTETSSLNQEIQHFLDQGRLKQEERIKLLSSLSFQLFGDKTSPHVQHVTNKNKDMLESFTVITTEIKVLSENIERVEEAQVAEATEREKMETDLRATQEAEKKAKAAAIAAELEQAKAKAKMVEEAKKHPSPMHMAPKFTQPLQDFEVSEGSKFIFQCRVEGYPEPQIQWFKDGIPSEANPDYQTSYLNGVCMLTIEETFSEDTATFTCRATNPAGLAETQGHLSVKESREGLIAPYFVKEPEDGCVTEGKPYQFQCEVTGNPLPLVSWYKNNVCIDSSTDFSVTYNNGYCTLSFEEATLDYAGTYTCRAMNQVGQIECTANLNVETSMASERPVFVTPLSNVMARAGQKLRLECAVTGYPEPQITWLHNSKSIKETRDIKMQFDGQKVTMVITEAFPKHAGVYTVLAKNKAGEAVSTCNVSVKGRLPLETSDSEMASDIEPAKPQVKQNLVDQTVNEGDKVRMDCIIVGQPEPEVIWYHNGKPVKESNDFQLLFEGDRCTLIIKVAYLEDAGSYKCVAINSGGEASSHCNLAVQATKVKETESKVTQQHEATTVEVHPKPPKFIRLLKDSKVVEDDTIKLECQVVGDPELSIRWFKDGIEIVSGKQYEIQKEENGTTTLTIPSVKQSHEGSFSVSAQNKAGEAQCFCALSVSPKSVPVSTQAVMPESPPTFLQHLVEQTIQTKQTAKFEAVVVGVPKPKVKWMFQNKQLTDSKDCQTKEDGDKHTLMISNSSKDNDGRYSVTAENNAGVATSSALLCVKDPSPVADFYDEKTSQSMIMSKKTMVVEKCTISSMEQITEPEPLALPELVPAAPSKIVETILPTVQVSERTAPPRFVKPVPTALITEGEKLFLEGQVEGIPEPECTWFKDNKELHSIPGVLSLIYGKPITSISIPKAKESDSGVYSCVATNSSGKATSTAEVRVKPIREAPKFQKPLQAGVVKSGVRVTMEVEITGIPKPDVRWYRNGSLLESSPDFRLSSSGNRHTLVIPEVFPDDSGSYMVVASNVAGEAKCSADLIVEDEKSPVEEKVISYHEISSIQQKKEMYTKISVTKSPSVQPYEITPASQSPVRELPKPVPKTPSPPPIPAVSSKVWSQPKPEPFVPIIEKPIVIEEVPEQYVDEVTFVEVPTATTSASSITKGATLSDQPKEVHPVQNGIKPDHVPSIAHFESAKSFQEKTLVTDHETVHSVTSMKSEILKSSSTESKVFQQESLPFATPPWKPKKIVEDESKQTWRQFQPFPREPTIASANIIQYQDTAVTPVLQTQVLTSAPVITNTSSVKTSYQSMAQFTSKEVTSKTEFLPKPIIKKDLPLEGPKPKKEVIIEEEPVVGAEVKPPVFSKVRGVGSFWRIS